MFQCADKDDLRSHRSKKQAKTRPTSLEQKYKFGALVSNSSSGMIAHVRPQQQQQERQTIKKNFLEGANRAKSNPRQTFLKGSFHEPKPSNGSKVGMSSTSSIDTKANSVIQNKL